jgi:drug/metabolite transporter (DMT)-like permease
VLVAVGAHLLLGERLTRARLAGVLLGFAGVAVVSAHEVSAASAGAVAALLGAAVCWAAGTLGTRATPEQPALAVVAAQHALAAPLLITLLLRRGEASMVAAWMFSVPIAAALLGVVLLGEPLRTPLAIGLVLVSLGVRLATGPRPAESRAA